MALDDNTGYSLHQTREIRSVSTSVPSNHEYDMVLSILCCNINPTQNKSPSSSFVYPQVGLCIDLMFGAKYLIKLSMEIGNMYSSGLQILI